VEGKQNVKIDRQTGKEIRLIGGRQSKKKRMIKRYIKQKGKERLAVEPSGNVSKRKRKLGTGSKTRGETSIVDNIFWDWTCRGGQSLGNNCA